MQQRKLGVWFPLQWSRTLQHLEWIFTSSVPGNLLKLNPWVYRRLSKAICSLTTKLRHRDSKHFPCAGVGHQSSENGATVERCILLFSDTYSNLKEDYLEGGKMYCHASRSHLEASVNFTFWRKSEESDDFDPTTMAFNGQNSFQEMVQNQPGFPSAFGHG